MSAYIIRFDQQISCSIFNLSDILKQNLGRFDVSPVRIEGNLECLGWSGPSWAPESKYVLHSQIRRPTFGFSQVKGNLEGKIGSFDATDFLVEEKLRCWGLFCSSWAPESKYLLHSRIRQPTFGFSQVKGNLKGKIGPFDATDVLVEEKHWCWRSFCSSWDADSEYVLHYLIPWTLCRISGLKVKSEAEMALFLTKIVNVEGRLFCWVSFCSSWAADSEYVRENAICSLKFAFQILLWDLMTIHNSHWNRKSRTNAAQRAQPQRAAQRANGAGWWDVYWVFFAHRLVACTPFTLMQYAT